MFCLFYDAATRTVKALNGSGRAPARNTLQSVRRDLGVREGESGKIPMSSVHAVTVPGAAAGWVEYVCCFLFFVFDYAEKGCGEGEGGALFIFLIGGSSMIYIKG